MTTSKQEPFIATELKKVIARSEQRKDTAGHPGERLFEEIKSRNLTQSEFSRMTNIPVTIINDIIRGKRDINVRYAVEFEKALGIDAVVWMNLQVAYSIEAFKMHHSVIEMKRATY